MIKRGDSHYEDFLIFINGRSWDFNFKGEVEPSFMWRATSRRTGETVMLIDRSYFGSFKELQNGINKKTDNKLSKKAHNLYKMNGED